MRGLPPKALSCPGPFGPSLTDLGSTALEREMQCELEDPGLVTRLQPRYLTERAVAEERVRVSQICVIENIQGFRPELQGGRFEDFEILEQGSVGGCQGRPSAKGTG